MIFCTDTDVLKEPADALRRLPERLYVVQFLLHALHISMPYT